MKEYSLYEQEQNKLLLNFLLKNKNSNMLEFIVSPECNQKCEYCYIYKYGDQLYPKEIRNFGNIIKNYEILLNWLEEQNFSFQVYDFFSGEFFNLPIWKDILEITYNHEIKRHEQGKNRRDISIPTNGSFLLNSEKTKQIKEQIYKFKSIGDIVHLSFSVEGPEDLEKEERAQKNSQIIKNDINFYDTFFNFMKEFDFTAHPMITKNFVKNYKKNYDWWIDSLIKYDITYRHYDNIIYNIPMMLEVRDAEQWDETSLSNYKNFLFYIAEKDLQCLHNNDLEDFAYRVFGAHLANFKGKYTNTQPYTISFPYIVNNMPCSIQDGAVFRLGDLAYVPCHRTMYPHFVFGHLITENNKIIGIEANRAPLAIKIKNLNPNRSVLKCASCPIRSFCIKGCLGSQYEHTNELFCADERVCNLFYTKYKTIHEIMLKYNLYDWVNKSKDITLQGKEFINYARHQIEQL